MSASTKDARIATALPSHPKTKKLVRRLGGSGAWHLVCLFLWAAANRPDGELFGMTDEDIELAVDWPGSEGEFVNALCSIGFLDGECESYVIHDWEEHNPWASGAKDRSDKSRFAALSKAYGRGEAAKRMPDYANRMPQAVPKPASGMPVADSGSATSQIGQCPASVSASASASDTVSVTASVSVSASNSETGSKDLAQRAAPSTRGTRLPSDWLPTPSQIDWARNEAPGLDIGREADLFRDYWIAKPGKDGIKTNWPATWRNWVRRSSSTRTSGRNNGSGNKQIDLEERNRRVADEWLNGAYPSTKRML